MSPSPFEYLCDVVASDRLVWLTGAGISLALERHGGGTVPGWRGLVEDVLAERLRGPGMAAEDERDVRMLLQSREVSSKHLIEAASIVADGWPRFDAAVRKATRPAASQPPAARNDALHDAMLNAQPRGIVTLNYDDMHERSLRRHRLGTAWDVLLPDSEEALARALRADSDRPFLLKAHGSIVAGGRLVLSYDTYRELLAKNPAYRTFVQNLLTNFSLVIVGFGLSDPDFDLFFDTLAAQFRSPLQTHVLVTIKSRSHKAQALEVERRRRWGIHTHYIRDWSHLASELERARQTAGPRLERALELCVSRDIDERREGHATLRELGPAGRAVALNVLLTRVDTETDPHVHSELTYSLGVPDPPSEALGDAVREKLLGIIDTHPHRESVAHAIDKVDGLVRKSDLRRLERRRHQLMASPLPEDPDHPDHDDRLPVYLERLILRVRAAERHWPRRPRS